MSRGKENSIHHSRQSLLLFLTCLLGSGITPSGHAFTLVPAPSGQIIHESRILNQLNSSADDDISSQLAKARALLEKAKAKVAEEKEQKQLMSDVDSNSNIEGGEKKSKRETVTKSTNKDTGLITTDGDLMAELSEEEDWEMRGLLDVFESEIEEDDVTNSLANRDVAASIQAMRISMQNEDYKKIFDSRNRWIGES